MAFLKNIPEHPLSDTELIALHKATGDLQALGQLYQKYMDMVYGVCLKYFKDAEAAKDATMQIFEELVKKLRNHEVENFKGWLHRVTKNYCLMQLRTPRNLKTVAMPENLMQSEVNVHLDGILEKEENFKRLALCLEELCSEQQQAIRLFYLEGRCYNEIAELMQLEWKQVRSFIQNGRRNLKTCIEKEAASEIASRI